MKNGEEYHTFRREDKNQSVRSNFSANRPKRLRSAYDRLIFLPKILFTPSDHFPLLRDTQGGHFFLSREAT